LTKTEHLAPHKENSLYLMVFSDHFKHHQTKPIFFARGK